MASWRLPPPTTYIAWDEIAAVPVSDYEAGSRNMAELDDWIDRAARFVIDPSDKHLQDKQFTVPLVRLLRLLLSKVDFDANKFFTASDRASKQIADLQTTVKDREAALGEHAEEKQRVEELLRRFEENADIQRKEKDKLYKEVKSLQKTIKGLNVELDRQRDELRDKERQRTRMERELEEAKRSAKDKDREISATETGHVLVTKEHAHLVQKYKEVSDALDKLQYRYGELETSANFQNENNELAIRDLHQQLTAMRDELLEVARARDAAEEALQRREAEALRDMEELQRIHTALVDQERETNAALREEIASLQGEADLARNFNQSSRFFPLQSSVERPTTAPALEATASFAAQPSGMFDVPAVGNLLQQNARLQEDLDSITAELNVAENKLEVQDAELLKLQRTIREYERGDEGLKNLRATMTDSNRHVEVLEEEVQQLRDRLNSTGDAMEYCASLKELCRRFGVSEEELNQLNVRGVHTESEILKQEVLALRDEIDWLEKERKYWMHKVRLQPLLDTKLRLELGLTPEQLRTVDQIVEQMKTGAVVVEGAPDDYREKFLNEVKERQRENAMFTDLLERKLEAAFQRIGMSGRPVAAESIVAQLRYDAQPPLDTSPEPAAERRHEDLVESHRRHLEQLEYQIRDRNEELTSWQQKFYKAEADRKAAIEERDKYRECLLRRSTSASFPSLQMAMAVDSGAGAVDSFVAVESLLRSQISSQESIIKNLQEKLESAETAMQEASKASEAQQKEADTAKADFEKLQAHVKELGDSLQESTRRVAELEALQKDLESVISRPELSHHKELLMKVVLLRKRESKLVSRVQLLSIERDEASRRANSLQSQVDNTLGELRRILSGDTNGSVLPPTSRRLTEESEMIKRFEEEFNRLQNQKSALDDQKYIINVRRLHAQFSQRCEELATHAELWQVKKQLREAEAALEDLRAENAQPAPLPDGANLEVELSTWKQKCGNYIRRLNDRETEVAELERQLESARAELSETRHKLLQSEAVGDQPQDVDITEAPKPFTAHVETGLADRETARWKSINLALLQTVIHAQSDNKILLTQLEGLQRQNKLLVDNRGAGSDMQTALLRDNVILKEQLELSQHQAKKLRLQMRASEANCHILQSEVQAYKMSSYRLYRQFIDHIVSIVTHYKSYERFCAGKLSLRMTEEIKRQMEIVAKHAMGLEGTVTSMSGQMSALQAHMKVQDAELAGLRQGSPIPEGALMAELRNNNRLNAQKAIEGEQEIRFLRSRNQRQEEFNSGLMSEISALESQLSVLGLTDSSLQKLEQLREAVFSKSAAPPPPILAQSVYPTDFGETKEERNAVDEYRRAVTRQSELNRECERLRKELADSKQQLAMAEARCGATREELHHTEQKLSEAQRILDEERSKFVHREQKLAAAHHEQVELLRNAAEHNSRCLREIVSNKEKALLQLQKQMDAERQRYLESALLDTTRMERLHNQLFRENAAMVDRFKAMIAQVSNVNGPQPTPSTGSPGADSPLQQIWLLTQELLDLRAANQDLRMRNATLEAKLDEKIRREQTAVTSLSSMPQGVQNALAVSDAPLLSLASDQATAIDEHRAKEQHLTQELLHAQQRIRDLLSQLDTLQKRLSEQHQPRPLSASSAREERMVPAATPPRQSQADGVTALLEHEKELRVATQRSQEEWRAKAAALEAEIVEQRAQVTRAKELTHDNQTLKNDIQAIKEQNEKLVGATAMLKQKLVSAAEDKEKKEQRTQQEIAITQRMELLQKESQAKLQQLQKRVELMQSDIVKRVQREEGLLKKAEEARKAAVEQQRQVTEREATLAQLRRQLRATEEQLRLSNAALEKFKDRAKPRQHKEAEVQADIPFRIPSSLTGLQAAPAPPAVAQPAVTPSTPPPVTQTQPAPAPPPSQPPPPPAVPPKETPEVAPAQAPPRTPPAIATAEHAAQATPRPSAPNSTLDQETVRSLEATIKRIELSADAQRKQFEAERDRLQRQVHTLTQRLNETKSQMAEKELEHKQQILDFLEEKRIAGETGRPRPSGHKSVSKAEGSSLPPVRKDAPPRRVPSPEQKTESDLEQATSVLKLHEQIRRQKKELDKLAEDLAEARKQRDMVVKQMETHKAEMNVVQEKARGRSPTDEKGPGSLREVRSHKSEILKLEEEKDALSKRLNVDKEAEIRGLTVQVERLTQQKAELEGEVARLRGDSAAPPKSTEPVMDTQFWEDQLLKADGVILGLRFERESLQLKVNRLERHIRDLLNAEGSPRNAGASAPHSARRRGGATATQVAELEGVVDQLKAVIERLQHENLQLKSSTVNSSKFVESTRELKALRAKEKELTDLVQQLTEKVQDLESQQRPGGKLAEQCASLQRRLKAALNAAEHYQLQYEELKHKVFPAGTRPPPPPPVPLTSNVTYDSLMGRDSRGSAPASAAFGYTLPYTQPPSVYRPGVADHRFDPHHVEVYTQSTSLPPSSNAGRPTPGM